MRLSAVHPPTLVVGLLVTWSLIAVSPALADAPLPATAVMTTNDKHTGTDDGWAGLADGRKMWIDTACRSKLVAAGLPERVLSWEQIRDTTQVEGADCGLLKPQLTVTAVLSTDDKHTGTDDGWAVLTDGRKMWIDNACRSKLVAGGLPERTQTWEQIRDTTQVEGADCTVLTPSTTTSSLDRAAPEVLQSAVPAQASSTGTTALTSTSEDRTVTASSDPAKGFTLKGSGTAPVQVGLPAGLASQDAKRVTSGAVTYDNGASNSVVVANGGGATVLAQINSAAAPERYSYPLKLSAGQTIRATENGGFVIVEPDGVTLALSVEPAWAKDATGRAIPVHYELDGTTVTMIVEHRSSQYVYPAVADPRFVSAWHGTYVYLGRQESKYAIDAGFIVAGYFVPARIAIYAVASVVGYGANNYLKSWIDRGWCIAGYKNRFGGPAIAYPYRC